MLARLDSAWDSVRRLTRVTVVVIFATMVVVVAAQVFYRFVLAAPLSWSEELARYLQVWLVLLTAAACLRKGMHLTVDYAVHGLPAGARRWIRAGVVAGLAFFLVVVIVSGLRLVAATVGQTTPALGLPMSLVYSALPVGAVLMLFEVIVEAGGVFRGDDADEPAVEEPSR